MTPDYRETVEKLKEAVWRRFIGVRQVEKRCKFCGRESLVSAKEESSHFNNCTLFLLRDALPLLTAQADELATCVEVRNSYQKACQRIGSALVKAGFEDDTTEAAAMSALDELATLRAENARLSGKPCTCAIDAHDYDCPRHGDNAQETP